MKDTIHDRIRAFVIEHFASKRHKQLSDDEPLIETGILDSIGILDLVAALENMFSIVFNDDDLTPANFHSLRCISALVEAKQKSVQAKGQAYSPESIQR